ncbi:MAG: hypothetical protein AAFO81_07105 [Pseudomonadota bacterium]
MPIAQELKRRNVFKVGIAYLVVSWIVLQVADVILGNIGAPPWLFKTLLMVIALGFPVALVMAWVFELTPDGLKRDSDVVRDGRGASQATAMLSLAATIVLAAILGYFGFQKWIDVDEPASDAAASIAAPLEKTIAVLPFTSRSASADDGFFVDGMHDDILNSLARISTLEKVISGTTMQAYRNTAMSVADIAAELGVAAILEGGLQRAGDTVRINMRLIDTATERSLWVQTFERKVTVENLFAIQKEITRDVVTSLNLALSDQDQQQLDVVQTDSLGAYEQYVLARARMALRTESGLAQAKAHFERAIELDEEYALAYVGLADALRLQSLYAGIDPQSTFAARQTAIDRALTLNPLSGEAYTSLAALFEDQGDLETAKSYFERAIELSPNYSTARHWYSSLLGMLGREQEMLVQIRKASDIEPDAAIIQMNEAAALMQLGRYDEVQQILTRAIAQYPAFAGLHEVSFYLWWSRGRPDLALYSLDTATRLAPRNMEMRGFQCVLNFQLMRTDAARRCISVFRENFPDHLGFAILFAELLDALSEQQFNALTGRLESVVDEQDNEAVPRALSLAYLGADKAEAAEAALRRYAGHYFTPQVSLQDFENPTEIRDGLDVARALQLQGKQEQAERLLQLAETALTDSQRIVPVDRETNLIRVHLIRGDWEQAAARLTNALAESDASYFFDDRTHFGTFDALPPVWLDAVALLNERVAEQRTHYESIKDSPLIP